MRLIIEPQDDIDPKTDVVAGLWCYRGPRYSADWYRRKCQPDPIETSTELTAAEMAANAEADRLLELLVPELNRRNCFNRSRTFWDVLLRPWLVGLTHAMAMRQASAQRLIAALEKSDLDVRLVRGVTRWPFKDTSSFFDSGVMCDEFNAWLLSVFLAGNLPRSWRASWRDVLAQSDDLRPITALTPARAARARLRFMGAYGVDILTQVGYSVLLSLAPSAPERRAPRVRLAPPPGAWTADTYALALACLPRCFDRVADWAPRPPRTKRGKAFVCDGFAFDETKKFVAACRIEAGERPLIPQHGGNYGNMRVSGWHDQTEYCRGLFLSWGWTEQQYYDVDAIPLPSPHLRKLRRQRKNDSILLVGAHLHAYAYRISSIPQPGEQRRYVLDKLEFIEHLNAPVRSRLVYRPYVASTGFNDPELVRSQAPDIPQLKGALHAQMGNAALVVLDHPGTTLNICMAANIPVVCFWHPASWAMSWQSEPYFEQLRAAGILFDSGRNAALQVNMVSVDVEGWWNERDTKAARRAWAEKFAFTRPGWRGDWAKALWRAT